MRCTAITKAGETCRLDATHGGYCYQHSPETAEERSRNARRGGKAGGNGRGGASELVQLKREVRALIADVLGLRIPSGPAAVALQGYNVILRAVRLELDIREQQELLERIEALERAAEEQHTEGRRWGA